MPSIHPKTPFGALFGFALAGLVSGCATIISWPSERVDIASDPPGARFKVERLTVTGPEPVTEGTTPSSVSLHRNDRYFLITVSREGYEPAEIPVEISKENWVVWLNLICGGLVGVIVDGISGASVVLEPDELNVKLKPVPPRTGSRASS